MIYRLHVKLRNKEWYQDYDFPSFAWDSLQLDFKVYGFKFSRPWDDSKSPELQRKKLFKIYGIANILFTWEKRDFNV